MLGDSRSSPGVRASSGTGAGGISHRFLSRLGLMGQLHRRRGDVHHVELVRQRLDDDAVVVELAGRDRLADGGPGDLQPLRLDVEHGGQRRHADLLLGERLDAAEQPVLARLGEGDGNALAPGAAGAADAVDVGLGRLGDVEVDDVGEVLDVEPAGGDVGGDEQIDGAAAGALHDAVALVLGHAAMQRLDPIAAAGEALGEAVDLVAGAAEDERERRRLEVEHAAQGRDLLGAGEDVGGLAHLGERAGRRSSR